MDISGKYNRMWILKLSKPEKVIEWYDFGALTFVHTIAQEFLEISKHPKWIVG